MTDPVDRVASWAIEARRENGAPLPIVYGERRISTGNLVWLLPVPPLGREPIRVTVSRIARRA